MWVIQLLRWILPQELAEGNTVYSCTFFKEINGDGSFHTHEDCQHDLLYWPLHVELFDSGLKWKTHVYLICKLFFSLKHASPYISYILQLISDSLYLSATKYFMIDLCSTLEHCLICCHFESFCKSFCKIKIIFALNQFQYCIYGEVDK